jgi:hypothetical protein
MTQYIEDNYPPIRDTGLNTLENASIGGTLAVTGATTLSSTLAVTGASTFTGVATFTAAPVFSAGVAQTVTNQTAATLAPAATASGTLYTLNKADGVAVTLPALAGASGVAFEFVFVTAAAGGNTTITAATGDLLIGGVTAVDTDTSNAVVFDDPDGTDDLIMTFNGTDQGGLAGTYVKVVGISATRWLVTGQNRHSGNFATIFS